MRLATFLILSMITLSSYGQLDIVSPQVPESLIRDNLSDVKKRLQDSLRAQNLDSNVQLERVGNTRYIFVSTKNSTYISDEAGDTLIPVSHRDVYSIDKKFSRFNLSNEAHTHLISMQQLWQIYKDFLPYYPPTQTHEGKQRIFAFIDLTCTYCRDFHLNKMENYRERGYGFIYIPFLRDPSNRPAAQLIIDTFCSDAGTIKERISKAYLINRLSVVQEIDFSSCKPEEQAFLKNTLPLGAKLGFIGSPLFITETGSIAFGEPSLNKIVQ